MNKRWLIGILVVVAIPALYFASTLIEYYEEEIDLGWSVEARRNPYLAAERFLRGTGMEVDSSYQLDVVDTLPTDATLFISAANHVLNQRRAQQLIEWMSRGGHVIVAAQVLPEGQTDVFLEHFDVEKYSDTTSGDFFGFELNDDDDESEDDKRLSERLQEENQRLQESLRERRERERLKTEGKLDSVAEELAYQESRLDDAKIMQLSFDDVNYEFQVLLDEEAYLNHPVFYEAEEGDYSGYRPFYWDGTDAGTGFMQFEVGNGLLTVISDSTIWTSDHIGLLDHAYLLELLTEASDKVVFLYGAVVPNIFQLLWQRFFELCIVLIALLSMWLLYHGRRFGPVLDTSDRGRRSFREHLSAVGDFFWRNKQRDPLLAVVRSAIWSELRRKYFDVRAGDDRQRLERLAEIAGESPERVQALMTAPASHDEFEFSQQVRSLQKIRKQL